MKLLKAFLVLVLFTGTSYALGSGPKITYPDQVKAIKEIQKYGHVGVAAWCTVGKDKVIIECNYNTKEECEGYRQEDEVCKQNVDYKE